MIRISNTMTRTKEEFVPLTPGEVRMYICGVTVYDYSHIGHARSQRAITSNTTITRAWPMWE